VQDKPTKQSAAVLQGEFKSLGGTNIGALMILKSIINFFFF
jgi:hypothetical protein